MFPNLLGIGDTPSFARLPPLRRAPIVELNLTHSGGKPGAETKKVKPAMNRDAKSPGWAAGLRKLYDSVVQEPLPDSFEDLLKKLDEEDRD